MKNTINKSDVHLSICNSLNELYKIKSSDYGDSFTLTRELIPNAILVRLHDKLNRLDTLLLKGNQQVNDESIEDTLRDLANYAILELVELEVDKATLQGEHIK